MAHAAGVCAWSRSQPETPGDRPLSSLPSAHMLALNLPRPLLCDWPRFDLVLLGLGDALDHVLASNADPHLYPAAGVRLDDGTLIWWVDRHPRFGNGR